MKIQERSRTAPSVRLMRQGMPDIFCSSIPEGRSAVCLLRSGDILLTDICAGAVHVSFTVTKCSSPVRYLRTEEMRSSERSQSADWEGSPRDRRMFTSPDILPVLTSWKQPGGISCAEVWEWSILWKKAVLSTTNYLSMWMRRAISRASGIPLTGYGSP